MCPVWSDAVNSLSMAVGNAEPPPWVSTLPAPHLSHCCLSPSPLSPWGVRDMSWGLELKNLQTVPWASRRALQQATDGGKQVEEMCPCSQGGPQSISHANTEVMVRKMLIWIQATIDLCSYLEPNLYVDIIWMGKKQCNLQMNNSYSMLGATSTQNQECNPKCLVLISGFIHWVITVFLSV